MNNNSPRYADWKAPDEDGQLLLWPDAGAMLRQTGENQRALFSAEVLIQNLPLGELRRRQRRWAGHADDDQPLIASGHQTELYHSGVWVKDALTNALARKAGGRAWHFAVDTDAPKHLQLRWPGGSMAVADDPRLSTASWSSLLAAPSPGHIDEIAAAMGAARQSWDFEPAIGPFLAGLKQPAQDHSSLTTKLTAAIQQLDAGLNLNQQPLLMSAAWMSEPYLIFAHHLLARADQFATQYNAALREYRMEQGIISPGRPMPDLEIGTDELESAFWLDDLKDESRQRLTLRRAGDGGLLAVGQRSETGDSFVFDPNKPGETAAKQLLAFLNHHHLRIAPRALPLTLFFRLFLADQYVHGIGGGRYDQVTDRIIAQFFKMDPPRFAVTTATLYFPAAKGLKRITLQPLKEEGRRLRHGSDWAEKREIASQIAALPRNSRQRRNLFMEMHARLAAQASSAQRRDWADRLDRATEQQSRQKTLFDRELFYALQSPERLREMISRYDGAVNIQGVIRRAIAANGTTMKLAFSTNAYTRHPLIEALRGIRRAGFSGVEILADTPHAYPDAIDGALITEVKRELEKLDLAVSNINVNCSFGYWKDAPPEPYFEPSLISPNPKHREDRTRLILKALDFAKEVGAANISITSGRLLGGMPPEPAARQFAASMRPILDRADQLGVNVGIECEPGLYLEYVEELRQWIDQLGSPRLGANLDVGHSQVIGESIPQAVKLLAGRIWNLHVEDIPGRKHYHLIPGQGTLDWQALKTSLQEIRYQRFLTVELYTHWQNPQEAAELSHQFLSGIFT